jgi:hypothetical protein
MRDAAFGHLPYPSTQFAASGGHVVQVVQVAVAAAASMHVAFETCALAHVQKPRSVVPQPRQHHRRVPACLRACLRDKVDDVITY